MTHIYAFKKGKIEVLPLTEAKLLEYKRETLWIDLKDPTEEQLLLLRKVYKVHPTTIEDIATHKSRTKVEQFKDYMYVVIDDIVREKGELEPKEIDILVGKKVIITAFETIVDDVEQLKIKKNKLRLLLEHGVDSLLYYILDRIMGHYHPFIDKIEHEIELLETKVTKNQEKKILSRIIDLRSDVMTIKKLIHPHRERIGLLSTQQNEFIREKNIPYFRDLHDDLFRISEHIENAREDITSVYDIYLSTISYNTNEVMKVLSIGATIILPLTLITGVYGMNFTYMPGLNTPYGFWLTMGMMAFLAGVMILFFKKQKWL